MVLSQINAPTLPQQQLLSFLFPPAQAALPDSRNVRVSVSGHCREYAIPFSTARFNRIKSASNTAPRSSTLILSFAPPSVLRDSRNARVSVSGLCLEFANQFGNGAIEGAAWQGWPDRKQLRRHSGAYGTVNSAAGSARASKSTRLRAAGGRRRIASGPAAHTGRRRHTPARAPPKCLGRARARATQ